MPIEIVPLGEPTDAAFNCTVKLALAPIAIDSSVVKFVPDTIENPVGTVVIGCTTSGAVPVLVTVMDCPAEVVPDACGPNVRVVADNDTIGAVLAAG